MSIVFRTEQLTFRYAAAPGPAVADLTLSVEEGALYAVIGPNGSGKSTLLRMLLGLLQPVEGNAWFEDTPATAWDRRQIARRIGVVTQFEELTFPFTVREIVAMGRYPHLGPWQREQDRDRAAILSALERCDVTGLETRTLGSLSGGERQRVRVARALAQEPGVLVLDEPTAALDIGHEMAVFELMAQLRRDGVTIVLATHNLNLAARFATHIALLDAGRLVASGTPDRVLERTRLESVYRWPITIGEHPGPGEDAGAPQVVPLRRPGRAPGSTAELPDDGPDHDPTVG